MSIIRLGIIAIVTLIIWLAFVFFSAWSGLWMNPAVDGGKTDEFFTYAVNTLQANNRGSSALVLIENGEVAGEFYASPDNSVNADTVFAAASLSKWFAATAMMKLVEGGHAELDSPVSRYLTRWQLPGSEFSHEAITIRRLLSHTAGFADGLGFGDYGPDEALPQLEEELANPRTSSGRPVEIAATIEPGTEFRYSGGSYLLLELLIEEISNRPFDHYLQQTLFTPLEMTRSGYEYLSSYDNHTGAYKVDGTAAQSYQYASSAATGLVISSNDLTRFVLSQLSPEVSGFPITGQSIQAMRSPHGKSAGFDIWGLGAILYAPTPDGDFIFGHDGSNDPAINTTARINPDTNDAIIVMINGHPSIATNIGSDWVLWQTGYPDLFATDAVFASMIKPAIAGCAIIAIFIFSVGAITRFKKPRA